MLIGVEAAPWAFSMAPDPRGTPPSAPVAYALQKHAVAWTLSVVSPALARRPARAFADVVPAVVREGDNAVVGRQARVLWGQEGSCDAGPSRATCVDTLLPGWYAQTNRTCRHCAVPLVPGIDAHTHTFHRRRARREHRASLAWECTICGHTYAPYKPRTARNFPSVRKRRARRDDLVAGRGLGDLNAQAQSKQPAKAARAQSVDAHAVARRAPMPALGPDAAPPPAAPPVRAGAAAKPDTGPVQNPLRQKATKADLRAMLAQKKQAQTGPAKRQGGLADFLSQL